MSTQPKGFHNSEAKASEQPQVKNSGPRVFGGWSFGGIFDVYLGSKILMLLVSLEELTLANWSNVFWCWDGPFSFIFRSELLASGRSLAVPPWQVTFLPQRGWSSKHHISRALAAKLQERGIDSSIDSIVIIWDWKTPEFWCGCGWFFAWLNSGKGELPGSSSDLPGFCCWC